MDDFAQGGLGAYITSLPLGDRANHYAILANHKTKNVSLKSKLNYRQSQLINHTLKTRCFIIKHNLNIILPVSKITSGTIAILIWKTTQK